MSTVLIRANVKPAHISDVEEAVANVFAQLDAVKPAGVRYLSYRLPQEGSYLILLELQDGTENPLPQIAAFREFQTKLSAWLSEPSAPQPLVPIGEYRAF